MKSSEMENRQLSATVGQIATLRCESLYFAVYILDWRKVFDRVDFLVSPSDDSRYGRTEFEVTKILKEGGAQWVSAERVGGYNFPE